MSGKWQKKHLKIDPLTSPSFADAAQLLQWFANNAPPGANMLLAHCYDGVVWGKRGESRWVLSSELAPDISPPLLPTTLMQARVFGEAGELFVWREGAKFYGRRVTTGGAEGQLLDYLTEAHWLWGTRQDRGDATQDEKLDQAGFTLLADGAQGLRHVAPLVVPDDYFERESASSAREPRWRPVRLQVEHYIFRDEETGLARVGLSRLVKLDSEPAPVKLKEG
jgi:CRISPR-associated protein (TIGR03984 family)